MKIAETYDISTNYHSLFSQEIKYFLTDDDKSSQNHICPKMIICGKSFSRSSYIRYTPTCQPAILHIKLDRFSKNLAKAVIIIRTVVFYIGNVCHTDEAWILNGVNPEQKADECTVCTGHSGWRTAHVVLVIKESDGKPWCRVQRDAHTPYVSLRSDTCNCTNWRNGVAYLNQNSHVLTCTSVKHANIQLQDNQSFTGIILYV